MSVVFSDQMLVGLAFHSKWPATRAYLLENVPLRFSVMTDKDMMDFGKLAFYQCHDAELVYEDEYRYFCLLMTLFGHKFIEDPRYTQISSVLMDTTQKARMKRTEPLVPQVIEEMWGKPEARQVTLSRASEQMENLLYRQSGPLYFPPCSQEIGWYTRHSLDQQVFVNNAKSVAARLRLRGGEALDVCFWAIWILGLDFDDNPQFRWLNRSIDKAGDNPETRLRRLTKWLIRLANNDHPASPNEIES